MKDFIVSLDIDETLIHSTEIRISDRQVQMGPFWTFVRPGLRDFLDEISKFSQIGIYTAAGQGYADKFVEQFMKEIELKFIMASNRCVMQGWNRMPYGTSEELYIKDLQKAVRHRHELSRLVAVDDKPYLYPRQYGNIIGVPAYKGATSDDVLPKLSKYLKHLSSFENVRTIEKRGWITQYSNDYNIR